MQNVRKKAPVTGSRRRLLWLAAAGLALAGIIGLSLLVSREPAWESTPNVDTSVLLYDYDATEVVSITIQRGSEEPWTAAQESELQLTLLGDGGYTLTEDESLELLEAASSIMAEDVLTEDPAVYAEHLEDYGLDDPRYVAQIRYADGTQVVLRVGDTAYDGAWRYMLIDGDDRLFAFSNGSVESLFVNKDTLRSVGQPTLHKARIDRITLTSPEGVEAQWTLEGQITDSDALDKWRIIAPFSYPADADAMSTLLTNMANLRLGSYVGPATEEALAAYGFDQPRQIIEIHMAAGTIGVINSDGAVEATDFPESTVTFIIGGEKSDMIDYVRCGDEIYLSSHFTMGMFIGYDVTSTMSRYPVLTALGNLDSLTIEQSGEITQYVITRVEQVAENNDLVTDEDGNVVYDISLTRNGEAADYAAFENAYNDLTLVTVSGTLPEGETATAEPHTVYTFRDVDGTMHTVALATFDVLHDAVIVDGQQAFYLIKGGFKLNMD